MDSVHNAITTATQSGTEPPSGVKGAGTIDSPYDAGNQPEQPTAQGTEPPSGIQGKGTVDQPYDQGNQPEQAIAPGTEPPSGIQGKGTVDEPYDQGNQPEQPTSVPGSTPSAQPSTTDPLASPTATHQGSGKPEMASTKEEEQVIPEARGRDEAAQRTTSTPDPTNEKKKTTAPSGHFDASKSDAAEKAKRQNYEERDVSPGEMKDGSHAVTSGARGESYTPGTFNKFKDKFHIGRGR